VNSIAYRPLVSTRIIALILCGVFSIASGTGNPAHADGRKDWEWSTDVIGVTEMQLSPGYWLERTQNANQLLEDESGIENFNKALFASDPNMVDLTLFPEQLAGTDVRDRIIAISKPSRSELYSPSGEVLGEGGYRTYTNNLGLANIPATVSVQYALVVSRADMRTYPTADRYYKIGEDQNLDRFQENGLFPGDAVAVLHTSVDGEWTFVQSYNYAAWMHSSHIAIGERRVIEQYKNAEPFLVITGDKIHTSFNPRHPALSELQLDMGIRIPLAGHDITGNSLYGQNPYASHAVLLPLRNHEGRLEIRPALIARSKDVSRGYIPFTRENIIRQAFKFLGERYGWGHSYNARDCTGFVMEVYKTFGILMPRNTGQQGAGLFGENTRFTPESSRDEKLGALQNLDVGDLIYVPGHVLMYIGEVNGEPYVIHDVSVFRYIDENGKYYEGTLNGVSVTPLVPLYGSRKSPYVDLIYNIKRLR
jgi:cell wall-associated NlpC family hydrolase